MLVSIVPLSYLLCTFVAMKSLEQKVYLGGASNFPQMNLS
jgi:hypothetical protein